MFKRTTLVRLQSLLALAVMVLALSLLVPEFRKVDNLTNILKQISVNLCLSVGMTLVILTGGIDLSVGAILGLAGAVSAGLFKNGAALHWFNVHLQFTLLGAIVAGLLVGVALGGFNGVMITRFRLPPFVATLGMLSIGQGLTLLWTGGQPITELGPRFCFMGSGRWLGVPMIAWIAVAIVLLFHFVLQRTTLGRYIFAVGGSERASAYAGLNVDRIKLKVYALAGGLAGLAGILQAGRVGSATPNLGEGDELNSIAAVVIGGTSLGGGRGSLFGTVLGCLIIGVLNNALVLLAVSPFWQKVVKGLVILAAVALDKRNLQKE